MFPFTNSLGIVSLKYGLFMNASERVVPLICVFTMASICSILEFFTFYEKRKRKQKTEKVRKRIEPFLWIIKLLYVSLKWCKKKQMAPKLYSRRTCHEFGQAEVWSPSNDMELFWIICDRSRFTYFLSQLLLATYFYYNYLCFPSCFPLLPSSKAPFV